MSQEIVTAIHNAARGTLASDIEEQGHRLVEKAIVMVGTDPLTAEELLLANTIIVASLAGATIETGSAGFTNAVSVVGKLARLRLDLEVAAGDKEARKAALLLRLSKVMSLSPEEQDDAQEGIYMEFVALYGDSDDPMHKEHIEEGGRVTEAAKARIAARAQQRN